MKELDANTDIGALSTVGQRGETRSSAEEIDVKPIRRAIFMKGTTSGNILSQAADAVKLDTEAASPDSRLNQ